MQKEATLPANKQNTNERIPITLTFHPLNQQIKHILYNNFNLLTDDDETADILQSLPLMAYRRDQNIKDILVRTKLPSTTGRSGTTPCKHPKCRTCTHSTTITNNNNSFHINANFTCSFAHLVYFISCKQCGMIYIGETSRQ